MTNRLFVLFIFCFGLAANAQKPVTGVVTDSVGEALPFAHVVNINKKIGTISNKDGTFTMYAEKGDSIYVSVLGYKSYLQTVYRLEDTLHIALTANFIAIDEVKIYPFKDYRDFRQAVLALRLEDNSIHIPGLPDKKPGEIPILEQESYISSIGFMLSSPLSYMYYNLSSVEKDKRNAHRLKQNEVVYRKVDKKLNYELVSRVVGVSDTAIITDFIYFCNFDRNFILSVNDYLLATIIQQKWELYCREHRLDSCSEAILPDRLHNISGLLHLPFWC